MKQLHSVRVWPWLVLTSLVIALLFATPPNVSLSYSTPAGWEQVGLTDDNVTSVVVPASNADRIYAATKGFQHGVFYSENGGDTWLACNSGLTTLDFNLLFLGDPQYDHVVYAVGDTTMFKTLNQGHSWAPIDPPYPPPICCGWPLCSKGIRTTTSSRTLYISLWRWAAHGPDCNHYIKVYGWALKKSQDAGDSWQSVQPPWEPSIVAVSPSDIHTVYISRGNQLAKTSDGGDTWQPCASVGQAYNVVSLAIHPSAPDAIFATTEANGVYRSVDGCGYWSSLNATLPSEGTDLQCPTLALHPTQPKVVFIGCKTHGMFWSTDGGTTWAPRNEAFNPYLKINSLSIAPLSTESPSPAVVYIGTEQGIWRLIETNIPIPEFNIFLPTVFKNQP